MENHTAIQSLIEKLTVDSDITVNYTNDYGVMFNLPGHDLYIYNEGNGWSFQLCSLVTGKAIEEAYEYECPLEMLEDCIGL